MWPGPAWQVPGAALGGGSGSQKLLRAAARGEFRWIWRVQQVPAGFQGCPIVLQPSCPFPSPFCAHLPQERLKFSKGTFQAMCFHLPFGRWAFSASHPTPTALEPCLWHSLSPALCTSRRFWPLLLLSLWNLVPGKGSSQTHLLLAKSLQIPHAPRGPEPAAVVQGLCGATRVEMAPGQDFTLCVEENGTCSWLFQLQT